MSHKPTDDIEWTIHALNIHGTFFEHWCAEKVNQNKHFKLESTNYPVEFPLSKKEIRGKESALDIRATTIEYNKLLTLTIECKKNNPEFIHWVFFPTEYESRIYFQLHSILNKSSNEINTDGQVETQSVNLKFYNIPVVNEGRETKGNYQSLPNKGTKTKTSNASISEAAYQVALATQAIFLEEIERNQRLTKLPGNTTSITPQHILFPIIVTTAHLYICEFNPNDIDPQTGEIPFEKAKLVEHPKIVFNYSLPPHLQFIDTENETTNQYFKFERYKQMQIMVIHSLNFQDFLDEIRDIFEDFAIYGC